ncbi:hypothetical protein COCON_G00005720 [Conger conger]|uniref:Uncharacterized protein n=1 Tax=Conger conger TaxID=82655 RepID=A0A9Q1E1H9_CONCO|nr:hypothetical protein COCON_G00005720 [Conger conger]
MATKPASPYSARTRSRQTSFRKMASLLLPAPVIGPVYNTSPFPPLPPFSAAATNSPTCHLLKTCCTRPPRKRRGGTKRSVWSRAPTPTSWMSSVQDATRSPQCSATLRPWCCVWAAPQCCVSPLVGKHVSQKDAHSGGSSISFISVRRGERWGWTAGLQ